MKRIIVLLLTLVLCTSVSFAQEIRREGNNFSSMSTSSRGSEPEKTKFTWTDNKGKTYPIYISSSGSCFVFKVSSRTGKEYRQYLKPEVSEQICKELGRQYTPRNRQ